MMIDPAWIAAAAAAASAVLAFAGVHVSGRVAQARLDATLEALEERVRLKSGEVDRATAEVLALSGRMNRAEKDIAALRDDVRETRDGVRDLVAKLG